MGGYEYFYRVGENISEPIEIRRTNINTKPFFRDITKPLLLKNEFNTYNIEYVVDNICRSEDFGGDNHVYLYYDNIYAFALLLHIEDITPYLKVNKVIFLFGEEELANYYPLDFKSVYGVDYEANPSAPVRVDEIKRLLLNWQVCPASGASTFFNPIMDGHPNTIKVAVSFTLSQFAAIYRCFLQGRTVSQFTDLFFTEYYGVPNWGGAWKYTFGQLFSEDSENIVFDGPNFQPSSHFQLFD